MSLRRISWATTAVGAVLTAVGVRWGINWAVLAERLPQPELATTPYTTGGYIAGLSIIVGAVGLIAWFARRPKPRAAAASRRPAPPHKQRYPLHAQVANRRTGETQVFAPGRIRLDFPTTTTPVVPGGIATPGTNVGRDAGLPPVSVGANPTTVLGGVVVGEVPTAAPQYPAVGTLTSRPAPAPRAWPETAPHASPHAGAVAAGGGSMGWTAAGRLSLPQVDGPRRVTARRGPDENA